MTYQVLARKWRPKTFAELIGQGPIVTALTNALTERRIGQAYLFSGIRGVGKTTAARLLAKALNCVHGPTATPCNECVPCREVAGGSDLDVIEVDAATYSKVEQVRELTESLKYGPARDRYKVVVLDEIHRLSRQAFDALLKIVEEPPRHLVFIFATTEIEAVPATILSRCQEFQFRRVPAGELAGHLREIATAEGIATSDRALRLVARAGEGSVRDSVALLDQLATFGGGTITDEDAAHVLGGLDNAFLAELLGALLEGRAAEVSRLVGRLELEGWDPRHAYLQLLGLGRDALRLAAGTDAERLDLPEEDAAHLADLARKAGYENLLRLLHHLLASETTVRRSEAGALALEIALLRAAELPKLVRIEELLAGGAPPPAPRRAPRDDEPRAAPPTARREVVSSPPPEPKPAPPPPAAAPLAPQPPATPAAAAGPRAALLEDVGRHRQPLAAHLEAAEALQFDGGGLLIVTRQGDALLARALEKPANRQVLDDAVRRVCGDGASWRLVVGRGGSPAGGEPGETADDDSEAGEPATRGGARGLEPAVAEHPAVQTLLTLFEGRVETVERQAGDGEEEG